MITHKLAETRDVLLTCCEDNETTSLINNAGFLLRFYEFNEEVSIDNIVESQMKDLANHQREALHYYNFTINGSKSDVYDSNTDVNFITCSMDNLKGDLHKELLRVKSVLYRDKLNLVVIYIDGLTGPAYLREISTMCTQFKSIYNLRELRIYTLDLSREVTGKDYKTKIIEAECDNYTRVVSVGLTEQNFTHELLMEFERNIGEGQKYYVTRSKSEEFTDIDWTVAAYLALRTESKIIFEDSRANTKYSGNIRALFSQDWNSFSARAKHVQGLKGNTYILESRDGNYTTCGVKRVKEEYDLTCIRLTDVMGDVDEPILRHLLEYEIVRYSADQIQDSAVVLKSLYQTLDQDINALLNLMRKIQLVSMYHLTDNLVGWNDICWMIRTVPDGGDTKELIFGVPQRYNDILEVDVYVGKSIVETTVSNSDLIPLGVFTDEFSKYTIEGSGEIDTTEMRAETLINISKGGLKDNRFFNHCVIDGLFETALQLLGYHITPKEKELYTVYNEFLGKQLIDKLPIDLNGRLGNSLSLSSLL